MKTVKPFFGPKQEYTRFYIKSQSRKFSLKEKFRILFSSYKLRSVVKVYMNGENTLAATELHLFVGDEKDYIEFAKSISDHSCFSEEN